MFNERIIKTLEDNRHMYERVNIHRYTDASCFDSLWAICQAAQEVTNQVIDMNCGNCLIAGVLGIYERLAKHYADEKAKQAHVPSIPQVPTAIPLTLNDEELLERQVEFKPRTINLPDGVSKELKNSLSLPSLSVQTDTMIDGIRVEAGDKIALVGCDPLEPQKRKRGQRGPGRLGMD